MPQKNGTFVISLDCELMWGLRDEVSKKEYGQHILGDHTVIPKLLDLFTKYQIRATFAYVGFLFCENKSEILANLPAQLPQYLDPNLSPYNGYITQEVGNSYEDDKYNFGWPQIALLKRFPEQEISTHTYSHYYCLEEGQTPPEFEADLRMALKVAKEKNIDIQSIIFPRNQVNDDYLNVCDRLGLHFYRGTEQSWVYSGRSLKNESLLRRFIRLADAYVNLSGHHCYEYQGLVNGKMVNIPSSRFLRPYTKSLGMLEGLRLRRITRAMTHAAKNNKLYHLWWHPHNFGINQSQNFEFLEKILRHYNYLHSKYGFNSKTMTALSKELKENETR